MKLCNCKFHIFQYTYSVRNHFATAFLQHLRKRSVAKKVANIFQFTIDVRREIYGSCINGAVVLDNKMQAREYIIYNCLTGTEKNDFLF